MVARANVAPLIISSAAKVNFRYGVLGAGSPQAGLWNCVAGLRRLIELRGISGRPGTSLSWVSQGLAETKRTGWSISRRRHGISLTVRAKSRDVLLAAMRKQIVVLRSGGKHKIVSVAKLENSNAG